jgi:hypothetical protein
VASAIASARDDGSHMPMVQQRLGTALRRVVVERGIAARDPDRRIAGVTCAAE